MIDEIEEFIYRRFNQPEVIDNFLNGNCYYFAIILKERFPYLNIYYLATAGHFCVKDECTNKFYDVTGTINIINDTPYLFNYIKVNEPNWYNRIVDGCIM